MYEQGFFCKFKYAFNTRFILETFGFFTILIILKIDF